MSLFRFIAALDQPHHHLAADHPLHDELYGDARTRGDRYADRLRNGMGSWAFLITFFAVMAAWAVLNTIVLGELLGGKAFDPYPYILLNLFLSMMAGAQGCILLISAKRGDAIAAAIAQHTHDHVDLVEEKIDKLLQLAMVGDESHRTTQ
jgi:uncharacterized membrane protein